MQFKICADFESILVPENNEKQNSGEPYRTKYQKHIVRESYLGGDAV